MALAEDLAAAASERDPSVAALSNAAAHFRCESLSPNDLSEASLSEICALWARSFPKPGRTKLTVAAERAAESCTLVEERWHIVWEEYVRAQSGLSPGRRAVAAARTFRRTIDAGKPGR